MRNGGLRDKDRVHCKPMLPEKIELNGVTCRLLVRRTARKNVIVRVPYRDLVQLSVPPQMSGRAVGQWLVQHRALLAKWQARALYCVATQTMLPEAVWYLGQRYRLVIDVALTAVEFDGEAFRLLPGNVEEQRRQLADFLFQRAREVLLPRLQELSLETGLQPEAMRLTRAKSFWGVCRGRRIALNWRLIGAPPAVIDYVCLHELCHLREANHSKAFWSLLNTYCAETKMAKQWLKMHRSQLFLLG